MPFTNDLMMRNVEQSFLPRYDYVDIQIKPSSDLVDAAATAANNLVINSDNGQMKPLNSSGKSKKSPLFGKSSRKSNKKASFSNLPRDSSMQPMLPRDISTISAFNETPAAAEDIELR
jgi:hypothetical protein